MKNIAIFGTGRCGKRTYDFLANVIDKKRVAFFCKTNVEENERFCDLKVISINEIEERIKSELIIIIAVYARKTVAEIKKQLFGMNFMANQIIEINSFILDNIIADSVENKSDASYTCLCCKNHIKQFLPAGEKNSELFERYHIIGGGYRKSAVCPICNALDRIRWQQYVLEHFTEILDKRCNVLHIAPEDALYRLIKSNVECDYYTGDIELGKAQHRCDLTNIQFKDNFFDYIIANHVLEHINRIDIAFDEIKRVLKSDGKLIISFPICIELKTREENTPLDGEARLKQFGQKDHVRLFGYDYKEYIEANGFSINVISPKKYLSLDIIKKYGFIDDDVILICSKRVNGDI
ncbi:MAG: class I SAM-dependent methyltransferase [Lachnospiraceae bacterium]|nr:class I SAM-dependent methyltransferase [Lachnospiraceae bacterium]